MSSYQNPQQLCLFSVEKEVQTVYLRRQGASREINTGHDLSLPYFISIYAYQDSEPLYLLEICNSCDFERYGVHNGQRVVNFDKHGKKTIDEHKRIAEAEVLRIFGEKIRIEDKTLGYMKDFGLHYPYMDEDIFLG